MRRFSGAFRVVGMLLPAVVARRGASTGSGAQRSDSSILRYPYQVVDTVDKLKESTAALQSGGAVALDVEAFCRQDDAKQLGQVSLVQACSAAQPVVYIFDVLTLTAPVFVEHVRPLMERAEIKKLFFDCRRDLEALSCQMGLRPSGVIDLQLYYTALQWKLRSVNRRSGMTFVLKTVANLDRQEGDAAVQTAMTVGQRAVWDVRPLPVHFLEYAADDVRHILFLEPFIRRLGEEVSARTVTFPWDAAVERLSSRYVEHYAVGRPVELEVDDSPAEVNVSWLESYIGPGGVCAFCGAKGHTEAECFRKQQGQMRCAFCGNTGHDEAHCYRKKQQVAKCEVCGQVGHTSSHCFKKNPCKYCGGHHSSATCFKKSADTPFFTTALGK